MIVNLADGDLTMRFRHSIKVRKFTELKLRLLCWSVLKAQFFVQCSNVVQFAFQFCHPSIKRHYHWTEGKFSIIASVANKRPTAGYVNVSCCHNVTKITHIRI